MFYHEIELEKFNVLDLSTHHSVCGEAKAHDNNLDGIVLVAHITGRHAEVEVVTTIAQRGRHSSGLGAVLVEVIGIEALQIYIRRGSMQQLDKALTSTRYSVGYL